MKTFAGTPRAVLVLGAAVLLGLVWSPVAAEATAGAGAGKAGAGAGKAGAGAGKDGTCLDDAGHAEGPAKCDACEAAAVWKGFVEHLKKSGREDLIPKEESEEAAPGEAAPARRDLQAKDPIRGVLFQASKDFVNLDALIQEAEGKPLAGPDLEKARALITRLRGASIARNQEAGAKDPFLKAYADYHDALLELDAGNHKTALAALEDLFRSHHFLPKRELHRQLARAYRGTGDDTLALLELQFFMVELPEENEADRVWAKEELKKIRDREHEGPLHDSEKSMRSISTLVSGLDVGQQTIDKERRVEDVLDKVAKLLERLGGT